MQRILQGLVMEKGNVGIFFCHIEFFNNLYSIIIIRVDGLFRYLWYQQNQFTRGMNYILLREPVEFSNDRLVGHLLIRTE